MICGSNSVKISCSAGVEIHKAEKYPQYFAQFIFCASVPYSDHRKTVFSAGKFLLIFFLLTLLN